MHLLCMIDSLSFGGAEHSLVAMTPGLVARGATVDVAHLHDRPGLHDELRAAGANVFSLAGPGGRLGWVERATRLIHRQGPDLLHTTLFEADIAGRAAATVTRVPVVSSLVNVTYGPEMFNDPTLAPRRLRGALFVDRLTARRVTRFHAITNHVAEVMSLRLRIHRDHIDVVPRGRDPEALGRRCPERSERVRAELGTGDAPLVVAAARQERQKGLDVLLRAWPAVRAAVPAARLIIAGREGRQTNDLRSTLASMPAPHNVTLLGPWPHVPDLLAAADVFVVPSRWEGLGSVLIEGMALEAPIVASDLPPIRETLGDGLCGLLVPVEDADRLAGAIVEVLCDGAGGVERTAAARMRFLEHYAIDRVAEAMMAFYGRALGRLA